jgi:hypothetical protein
MLTIVRSSRVMKNPSEMVSSTAHGFPRNFVTTSPLLSAQPAVNAFKYALSQDA